MIEIIQPGIQSSLQDTRPRRGLEQGVPQGGAADAHSAQLANIILEQDPHLPVLEIPSSPITIRFHQPARISLTGGGMLWHLSTDSDPSTSTRTLPGDTHPLHLHPWRSHPIPAGATLTGRPARPGFRAYLGIASGFSGQSWLGSYSTELRLGAGGTQRALKKGDILLPNEPYQPTKPVKNLTKWHISPDFTAYLQQDLVRIFPAPESSWFSDDTLRQLTAHSWNISRDSNRMGIRLQSDTNKSLKSPEKNLISTVVLPGTIQLTPSGPIILGPDAQTSGGYPRIAQVCQLDQRILAQKSPGESIRFQWITLAEAIRISSQNDSELQKIQNIIAMNLI